MIKPTKYCYMNSLLTAFNANVIPINLPHINKSINECIGLSRKVF